MRIVGLISGGKDSIYNLMHCVAAGHNLIALANLHPHSADTSELDSFMYQTVGHEGVSLIAQAMGLPLYRQPTHGKSACTTIAYQPTETDEVEDLFSLLSRVKMEMNCEGVAVGAIASDYQRCRVENVCCRLNLTSLAYLWKMDQRKLLREMIESQVDAVLVKVASMGLEPEKHLGMSLSELEPFVLKLNEKYGVNVCGEGGEYESFVLDCPLYHKKIVLESKELMKDPGNIGASGHLIIKSAKLDTKYESKTEADTWAARIQATRTLVRSPLEYGQEEHNTTPETREHTGEMQRKPLEKNRSEWQYSFSAGRSLEEALEKTTGQLIGFTPGNLAFVNLWIRRMEDFAEINQEYVKLLPFVSPARACVATALPEYLPVAVELVCKRSSSRESVHVQSVSHWAPANIGPYSQAVKVDETIFVAGQIPLIPGSMTLLQAPIEDQVKLSLRHVDRVLNELKSGLSHTQLATVYVSKAENLAKATQTVRDLVGNDISVVGVVVSQLPRLADVEVVIIAVTSEAKPRKTLEEMQVGEWPCQIEHVLSPSLSGFVCRVKNVSSTLDEQAVKNIINSCTSRRTKSASCLLLRIQYAGSLANLQLDLKITDLENNRISIVPVIQNDSPTDVATIIGLFSS